MAEIHVQTKRSHINPGWVWTWVIIAILIIAAVVYFVYNNKDKNDQNAQTQHNTPVSAIELPHQFNHNTYFMRAV